MQLAHHAFCYRSCRFSAIAPKEWHVLCQMVSSELNFKNLTCDHADSALLWPCSKECPCKETGGTCPPCSRGPCGQMVQKGWQAGLQAWFQFLFPETLHWSNASTSRLGQAWHKRGVHCIIAFPNILGFMCWVTAWKVDSFPHPSCVLPLS